MNILDQYYHGITQQLRSEIDFINTLFHHQGIKGEGNESVLRSLISKFIPNKFGIGTGIVIDKHGNQSKQCDIIIYDSHHYPSILALSHVHIFPVDLVYAIIEVKTTLTSSSAKQALENINSVRRLDYIQDKIFHTSQDGEQYTIHHLTTSPPLGIVFSYNSQCENFETFKEWFTKTDNTMFYNPYLITSLDKGILLIDESTPPHGPPKYAERIYGITDETSNETLALSDEELKTNPNIIHEFLAKGCVLSKVGGYNIPVVQSRAMLNFLFILNEYLNAKLIHPNINFRSAYFSIYANAHITSSCKAT